MLPLKRIIVSALLVLSISYCFGQAPTISYNAPQYYLAGTEVSLSPSSSGVSAPAYSTPVLLGSGFHHPTGVHVDAAGNVYVTSYDDTNIKMIPAGSNTPVAIGSGFYRASDVTTDAAGNIYVADGGNNAVKKIPAGSNIPVTFASGIIRASGVAVTADGTVYVAEYGPSPSGLIKIAPGGVISVIPNGVGPPLAVAVDELGNIYESSYPYVHKFPLGDNIGYNIGTGFEVANGLAVDLSGNIFVADSASKSVMEILAGSGITIKLNIDFVKPCKIAVGSDGALYIADFESSSIKKCVLVGGYNINKQLPPGLTFNNATGVISGTPTFAFPKTLYTITAYNSYGYASAQVNIEVKLPPPPTINYGGPKSYIINQPVNLAPTGSGTGPKGYDKGTIIASGLGRTGGIAVDTTGNVYFAEPDNNAVKKIPVGGGAPVPVGSGFNHPSDVTLDAAGNLYIADMYNGMIKKIPAGSNVPVGVGSTFGLPAGVDVDAAGNLYVAAAGNTSVEKILTCGAHENIGSLAAGPTAIAVDAYGNIYINDNEYNPDDNSNTFNLLKIPAGSNRQIVIDPGVSVGSIAVDPAGNVFEVNGNIKELSADTNMFINLNIRTALAVATDGLGNLYVTEENSSVFSLTKIAPLGGFYINKALPPGLTFNNTTGIISGIPTKAIPANTYTITAYNFGGGTSTEVRIQTVLPPLPPPATISYPTPVSYLVNKPVSLSPTESNISAPGYNTSAMTMFYDPIVPNYVTTDATGNIYVAYETTIKRIPAAGGTSTIIYSGSTSITGLAVDSAGNVYVSDYSNNAVKKIPAGSNAPIIIGSGFFGPRGLAVDAAGNLYIEDYRNNAIKKIPAGSNTPVTLISGLNELYFRTVDAQGNVYATNLDNIIKFPAGTSTPVTIGPDNIQASSLAVDNWGNVFATIFDYNTFTYKVNEILAGTNTAIGLNLDVINPLRISIDGYGALIIADHGDCASIKKIVPSGGHYINRPLPAGLNIDNSTGVISGTPTAPSPATNYVVSAYNARGRAAATVNIEVAAASTDADLKALTLAGALSPSFTKSNYNYSVLLGNAVTHISLTPTADAAGSSITVNGEATLSGTSTKPIPLTVGPNIITIIVTAQDSVTQKIYTVTVTRASTNAGLSAIMLNPKTTLTTVTGPGYHNYTTTVPNTETSLEVIPTAQEPNATIKVNGTVVPSGVASQAIPLTVGSNVINIVVTAQDSATTKTYIITATRAPSSVATLSSLVTSSGTLSPAFTPSTTGYNVLVPNATTTIKITPTVTDSDATVKVNGVAVSSGSPSASIPLAAGSNTITTVVTAADGTSVQTYTLTITHAAAGLSANATLTSIKLNPATTLTTVTGPGNANYTTTVPYTETSLKIIPTAQEPNATIKVNGTVVPSGVASQAIPLTVGSNVINIVVTAQDSATTKTYIITATRAPSSVATLSSLVTSSGTLSPSFTPSTTGYNVLVPNVTTTIKITPTVTDSDATVKVNGVVVSSGSPSASIPLAAGSNTITTVVTAADGTSVQTYYLTITHAAADLSANATLTSIKLNPATTLTTVTGPGNANYTTTVPYTEISLKIIPTAQEPNATIKVNGMVVPSGVASQAIPLTVGSNVINVVVTAQDGATTKTYIITASRAEGSNNATLTSIKLTPATTLTTVTGPGYGNFTTTVPNSETSVKLTLTAQDATATIRINGTVTASGLPSSSIPLNVGNNVINIVVTAQNTTTTKTYIVTATRAAASMSAQYNDDPADILKKDDVFVHQAVSPNGDGDNDVLIIDGIIAYPSNSLTIMARSGALVFEAKSYNNSSVVFDGHSDKTGKLQPAGTYFYKLNYKDGLESKTKTGFILLKY